MMAGRVLVVAPGQAVRGGITSVVRTHTTLPSWERWRCVWVETLAGGGSIRKLLVAATALVSFMRELPCARIVHIHVAWKNSALRKLPFFILAKACRRVTIVHWHAPDIHEALRGLRGSILGFVLRHADRVVVLSEYWRSAAVSALRIDDRKIVILPNPVPVRASRRQPAAATILFAGKLEPRKGVTTLIRAFRLVRSIRPSAELRLAGDNVSFLDAFSQHELEGVTVLGWLSPEQLERELCHATCLCLPSRGEGVPMAVLEAMASGCPVVTTLVGGLVDLMRHEVNGFVVEVDDVRGLAQCLLRVLDDPSGRERVADTAARALAQTHSLPCVDRHLSELYSAAVTRL